jgi:hypothetical protein
VPVTVGERERFLALGEHVTQLPASGADEVLVGEVGVRVVPLGTGRRSYLEDLAHRHEFVQSVVNRGEADLGEKDLGATVNGLCGEVDVLTVEDLGDDSSLRREPPITSPQAFQEIADGRILPAQEARR